MMKTLKFVLLATLFLAGCGDSTPRTSSSPNLTGTWLFTATSNAFSQTTTANGTLTQNGTAVVGQIILSGSPCATSVVVAGNISSTSLALQADEGGQLVNFTGTVNSTFTSASGNYTAPSGGCTNGDFGTWTGTKTK